MSQEQLTQVRIEMRQLIIGLTIGTILGLLAAEYTTVFRASCDTTKYGWGWANLRRFSNEPMHCKDSNQVMERETNPYMIYQVIRNEILY